MIIRTAPERPVIFALRLLDWQIVDGSKPQAHQPVLIEPPILISIRAKLIPRVIVPFIGKTHGDTVSLERPKLLDQPILQLFRPFASEKRDNFLPSVHKFRAVSPTSVNCVSQGHLFRITRVPAIFCQSNLLNSRFACKWRQRSALSCGLGDGHRISPFPLLIPPLMKRAFANQGIVALFLAGTRQAI